MTSPKHTDTSRSGDLKPCPFCGEQCAVLNEDTKWAGYQPSCLEVRTGYDSSPDAKWRTEAINAWNNRPADRIEALEAENERLCEALKFYARENSWRSCGMYMSGRPNPSAAEIDAGNKARKALEPQQ